MVDKNDESDDYDYDAMADGMKKAGVVTEDGLKNAIDASMKQYLESHKDTISKSDVLKHLNGECPDENCDMRKQVSQLYNDAFVKGATLGIKAGGIAAKKGIFLK